VVLAWKEPRGGAHGGFNLKKAALTRELTGVGQVAGELPGPHLPAINAHRADRVRLVHTYEAAKDQQTRYTQCRNDLPEHYRHLPCYSATALRWGHPPSPYSSGSATILTLGAHDFLEAR